MPAPTAAAGPCDLVVRAARVVADGREQPLAVSVRAGRIVGLDPIDAPVAAVRESVWGADVVVLPGLVDTHVHVCEPGHTAWEGFATATAAAAAGGITTVVDMPVDSTPATVDVAALDAKRDAAAGKCHVDVAFWGGVTPTNLDQLDALGAAGVVGLKCFLVDSGAEDLPAVGPVELEAALGAAARLALPLMVHAEVFAGPPPVRPGRRYGDWLATRPPSTEDLAVALVVDAARRTGGRAHVAHLSSAGALPAVEAAQADGVAVSAETCPHYLALRAEDVADGDTSAKCSPPIRDAANAERLWDALGRGVIGAVVSDHSPCAPEMRDPGGGDFATAWAGIASLQLALPVVWSAARGRGFGVADLARWMAEVPADLAGLGAKGRIAVGADADLCVLAPDETFVVDPARLRHRHPATPYGGRPLAGVVRATMLRGAWADPDGPPRGRLLVRRPA